MSSPVKRCEGCDLSNGCEEYCRCRPNHLVERLQAEADLCRNEGAEDIAALLDEAVVELRLWRNALWKACGDDGRMAMATLESQGG